MNKAVLFRHLFDDRSKDLSLNGRIAWVDYARGFGIFLVVLGHVLRGLVTSSVMENSLLFHLIDRWIYAFHMPLFFFISGLFAPRSTVKPFKAFIAQQLQTTVYAYILWSLIQLVLQAITDHTIGIQSAIERFEKIFFAPVAEFWFLYVLFVLSVSYVIVSKLKISSNLFFLICALLYGAHLTNINFGNWGVVYQVRAYALFFALGIVCSRSTIMLNLKQLKSSSLVVSALTGFVGLGFATSLGFVESSFPVLPFALLGIAATIALAHLLERLNMLPFLKRWGQLSLQIYVAHTIAAAMPRFLLRTVFGVSEPAIYIIVCTAVGICAPIALNSICQRLKFPYLFSLRPLSVSPMVKEAFKQ